MGQGSTMLNAGSFVSNLKHIFPVTCAVPDLSTITEMSDSSRKPALEDLAGLTGDDFNSLSVFDSNFNVWSVTAWCLKYAVKCLLTYFDDFYEINVKLYFNFNT